MKPPHTLLASKEQIEELQQENHRLREELVEQ